MTKDKLRTSIRTKVDALTPKEKNTASVALCEQLQSIASVSLADTIFAYLPLEDEIDLRQLLSLWIDESRTVCVPHVVWEDVSMTCSLLTSLDANALMTTRHGLQEPVERQRVPVDSIDVVLVPGIGFDPKGGRLGRGGGYYDRFLSDSRPPVVIGVAFDEQVVTQVPREPHDQMMSVVVTPTKILL